VEQRERVKALRRTALKRNRETGALEDAETPDPEAELYNRQGEDLLDDAPLCMCFMCCSSFVAPRIPERDASEPDPTLDQVMRNAGFCQDCQKVFYLNETAADLQQALHRYHKRFTVEHPPDYLVGSAKLFRAHHRPTVMAKGSRNVILGLTLEKFVSENFVAEAFFPRVKVVKQGQAEAQGVRQGDKMVAVNGWWLPPGKHHRIWDVFSTLQVHYLGPELRAPVQMVDVTWARSPAEEGPDEGQKQAQADAQQSDVAVVPGPAEGEAPTEPTQPVPQAEELVQPGSVAPESGQEAPVVAPAPPASPTSVVGTDDEDAQKSVVGSPTEVVHSSDVEMSPREEEAVEAGESQPLAAPLEEMS
jgi:hypothetical protein